MSEATLDASALLAVINEEPGADLVQAFLDSGECTISTVNQSEVVTKLLERGMPMRDIRESLGSFALSVVPFDELDAFDAASLRPLTRHAGLSLGDRACVVLAARLGTPVVTTDRSWTTANLPVEVILARPA